LSRCHLLRRQGGEPQVGAVGMTLRNDLGAKATPSSKGNPMTSEQETQAPKPCPFCGTEMHDHGHCFSHPRPAQGDCVLRDYSFDKGQRALWNARHQPEREAVLAEAVK